MQGQNPGDRGDGAQGMTRGSCGLSVLPQLWAPEQAPAQAALKPGGEDRSLAHATGHNGVPCPSIWVMRGGPHSPTTGLQESQRGQKQPSPLFCRELCAVQRAEGRKVTSFPGGAAALGKDSGRGLFLGCSSPRARVLDPPARTPSLRWCRRLCRGSDPARGADHRLPPLGIVSFCDDAREALRALQMRGPPSFVGMSQTTPTQTKASISILRPQRV